MLSMLRKLTLTLVAASLGSGPGIAADTAAPSVAPVVLPPSWSLAVPGITGNPEQQLCLDLSTGGRVVIQLRPDLAPAHVDRIKKLARDKFYDGLKFHRVIDGFMAQTGDPTGTGSGDSKLPDLEAEFNAMPHLRGVLSAARTDDPNSANSQFFIVFQPSLFLDNNYTAFGRVVSGMQFVDTITRGEPPENPSIMVQASVCGDKRKQPVYPPQPAVPTTIAPATDAVATPISDQNF